MREIKFRAWDKHAKKMGKVTGIIFSDVQHTLVRYQYVDDKGRIVDDQSHIDEKGCGCVALMQYTGLKDKNGVEVYEGDVLKCRTQIVKTTRWIELKEVIEDIRQAYHFINFDDLEIIGNIYNNPELLEATE